jgi:hypothetical protein
MGETVFSYYSEKYFGYQLLLVGGLFMVGQLNAISRRLKDNRVRQRRTIERLWSKCTLAVEANAFNLSNGVKGLVQGFHGRYLESQMVESDVLAAIKRGGALIRLPNSEQRRAIREEKGRIGFDTANLLVANRFKEFKRSIEITDGETDVGEANGQVARVSHAEVARNAGPCCGRRELRFCEQHLVVSKASSLLLARYSRDLFDCSCAFDLREQDPFDCSCPFLEHTVMKKEIPLPDANS